MQCLSNSVLLLLACLTTGLTSTLCPEKGLAKLYQAIVKGLSDAGGLAEAKSATSPHPKHNTHNPSQQPTLTLHTPFPNQLPINIPITAIHTPFNRPVCQSVTLLHKYHKTEQESGQNSTKQRREANEQPKCNTTNNIHQH